MSLLPFLSTRQMMNEMMNDMNMPMMNMMSNAGLDDWNTSGNMMGKMRPARVIMMDCYETPDCFCVRCEVR